MLDFDNLPAVETLTDKEALDIIAQMVDHAHDTDDLELTSMALSWCQHLDGRALTEKRRMLLDYYRANAWGHRQHQRRKSPKAAWEWDQEEVEKQILFLRRALNNPAHHELSVLRQCQILTNLGNLLDTAGRFIEARALWTDALRKNPDFWMARGNRGRGLMGYANALYDGGHKAVFALTAHGELLGAVRDLDQRPEFGDPKLRPYFQNAADRIAEYYKLETIAEDFRPEDHEIVDAPSEGQYQRWCLRECLYLNPLNDAFTQAVAAQDVLHLPSFITSIDEPPTLIGLFNQMKQEFVSARWMYYDGMTSDSVHHSDHRVLLYNTLDYPAFGLAIEQLKIAFRMSYSLLDKIAYFLNRYLKLGIPEKRISFRTIWRDKPSAPLRAQFAKSENLPFRGLYWLSKDLYEKHFDEVADPDARELAELRNHLEHKYVKVLTMKRPPRAKTTTFADPFFDDFAHVLTLDDLERRALRLLKLSRAALIYLSLGMHVEEQRRRDDTHSNTRTAPMKLHVFDDERKRRY